MLEAGNKEKVFTPLIGKGINFIVKGKPADEILLGKKVILITLKLVEKLLMK